MKTARNKINYNTYKDKNGKEQARQPDGPFRGQYGHKDQSRRSISEDFSDFIKNSIYELRNEPFFQTQQELKIGNHKLGGFDINIGLAGMSVNSNIGGAEFVQPVNKNFVEVKHDENYLLIGGMVTALQTIGLPIHKMTLKEYVYESPGVSGGFNFDYTGKNAHAGAQLFGIRFLIDTPYGEMTARLKADASLGKSVKNIMSKNGKKFGANVDEEFSVGYLIEFSMPEETRKNIQDAALQSADKELNENLNDARTFWNSIFGEDLSATRNQDEQAVIDSKLLDKTVEILTDNKNDPKAESLREAYKNNPETKKAFSQFQKDLSAHVKNINDEKKLNDWLNTFTAAGAFLGKLALISGDKSLSRWATGISAMTEGVKGVQQVGGALSALANRASFASVAPSLFSGAGAILGIASVLMSFSSDDNGSSVTHEMLMDIKQTILDMWQEQRESFVQTWQMLGQMEENDRERFKISMEFWYDIYLDLRGLIVVETQKIDALKEFVRDRLDNIENQSMKQVVDEIYKTSADKYPEKCANWASTLKTWLSDTAFNYGTANTHHNEVDELQNLNDFITSRSEKYPEHIKFGVPLTIAHSAGLNPQILKLPNLRDYLIVLHIYCELVSISAESIIKDNVQNSYRQDLAQFKQVLTDAETFLKTTAGSTKLWQTLIDKYQDHFSKIEKAIAAGTLPERSELDERLPSEIRWSLLEDADANIKRFEALPDAAKIKGKLSKRLPMRWNDLIAERDQTIVISNYLTNTILPILTKRVNSFKPFLTDNLFLGSTKLSSTQFDNIYNANAGAFNKFNEIESAYSSEFLLALSHIYGISSSSIKFSVGDGWNDRGNPNRVMPLLILFPSLLVNGKNHPFMQIPFSPEIITNKGQYGLFFNYNSMLYKVKIKYLNMVDRGNRERFIRDQLELENINLIDPNFDLITVRKEILTAFNQKLMVARQEALQSKSLTISTKNDLNKDYRSLIAMIKLFTPGFTANYSPEIIDKYNPAIENAIKDGSLENLKELYKLLSGSELTIGAASKHAKVWQQDIWLPFAPNENELTAQTLADYASNQLEKSTTLKELAKAKETITEVQKQFSSTASMGNLTPEEMKERQIAELNRKAFLQQKALWKKLSLMYQLLSQEEVIADSKVQMDEMESILKNVEGLVKDFEKILPKPTTENQNSGQNDSESSAPAPYLDNTEFSLLQNLCANPDVDLSNIKQEMEHLEKEEKLDKALNQDEKNIENRPLQLAIKAQRADVVELLLQHDAKIEKQTIEVLKLCQDEEAQIQISYLLDFYGKMQEMFDADMKVGRTLGLINESIHALNAAGELDTINVVIGETRDGKSSIVNCCAGVNYKQVIIDEYTSVLEVIGNITEKTRTSNSTKSETSYPHIVKTDAHTLVDMCGFEDGRGVAWDVANGVSTQLLGHRAKSLGGLILVFDATKLMTGGINQIINPLSAVAKMVHSDETLMSHVVVVVNRAAPTLTQDKVSARFKRFINENPGQDLHTIKLLEYLKDHPEKIIPSVFPDANLRKDLLGRLDELSKKPAAIGNFNFAHFSKETDRFKKVIKGLLEYREMTCKNKDEITQSIVNRLITLTKKYSEELNRDSFLTDADIRRNYPGLPSNVLEKAEKVFIAQKQLRDKLMNSYHELSKHLNYYHAYKADHSQNQSEDPLDALFSMTRKADIASEFLQAAAPIIQALNMSNITSYESCKNVIANQTSSHNPNEAEVPPCASSSWGISGACGQIISESFETLPDGASSSASGNDFTPSYGEIFEDYLQSSSTQLVFLQWFINTWVNPYLPSNQMRKLTSADLKMLQDFDERFSKLLCRYYKLDKNGLDQESLQWVQNTINKLGEVVSNLLDPKQDLKVTTTSLNAIRNKLDRVDEQLTKLAACSAKERSSLAAGDFCSRASTVQTVYLPNWNMLAGAQPRYQVEPPQTHNSSKMLAK